MNAAPRSHQITLAVCSALFLAVSSARAVPSFSRQTGLPCNSCHITILELTPLGRLFKLSGYVMTGNQQITSKGTPTQAGLNINTWLPLSAFIQVSDTNTNSPQPGTQNGNVEFPQAISLFLAGGFANHFGGLIQVTYSGQDDHFTLDNTDLRYANRTKLGGKELLYGITINNNPTVEDVWHSTPAWGFPWVAPDSTPTPAAGAVIDGGLAADVGGVGAYTMWDNHLYAAGTLYRSAHLGAAQPPSGEGAAFNIRGTAPYWRLAWQQTVGNNYLEVGTYGLHVSSSPNTIVGPTDVYTDVAADLQYERVLPTLANDMITVHSTYIHQSADLNASFATGASSFLKEDLNTFRADGTFHFGNKYAATAGAFSKWGTPDPLIYAQAAVGGSASGSPASKGYTVQFAYWPVQNIQLTVQYTGYLKFNGGSTNYDGAGRNASANNAVYGVLWLVF